MCMLTVISIILLNDKSPPGWVPSQTGKLKTINHGGVLSFL